MGISLIETIETNQRGLVWHDNDRDGGSAKKRGKEVQVNGRAVERFYATSCPGGIGVYSEWDGEDKNETSRLDPVNNSV